MSRHDQQDFRSLVDVAQDAIGVISRDGQFLYMNQQGYDLTGYCEADLDSLTLATLTPEDKRDRVNAYLAARNAGRPAPDRYETTFVDHDGRRIPVEITVGPTTWEGQPAYSAIVRDISERERAGENLRRRDRALAAITFAMDALMRSDAWEEHVCDALANLGAAMDLGRVSLGEVQVEPSGRTVVKPIFYWAKASFDDHGDEGAPGTRPIPFDNIAPFVEMMKAGQVVHNEGRQLSGPITEILDPLDIGAFLVAPILVGQDMWGLLSMGDRPASRVWSPVEIDVIQIAADIFGALVRRRRTEDDLRRSESMYRNLIEIPNLSIVTLDRNGVFQFANDAAAVKLGAAPGQIIGKTIWDYFPQEYADKHLKELRRALDSNNLTVFETQTMVDGRLVWREMRIQPLIEPTGSTDHALVIAHDISERKAAEEAILAYQARLRSLTSDLLLTEQRERRRIAGEIHDRIGQALVISKMKLGAVARDTASEEAQMALGEVSALIDQTIQDTRTLTFDLSPPVLHELGLAPALEWLVDRLRDEHGIDATFRDAGEALGLGDECRILLFQSVQELLANTVRHAQARRVEVSIRQETGEIIVETRDDGVGFDAAKINPADGEQTGYGLFSTRERVSHLGGRLDIRSQPGRGTRIILRVPHRSDASPCEEETK